jgi:hypothetical protein
MCDRHALGAVIDVVVTSARSSGYASVDVTRLSRCVCSHLKNIL